MDRGSVRRLLVAGLFGAVAGLKSFSRVIVLVLVQLTTGLFCKQLDWNKNFTPYKYKSSPAREERQDRFWGARIATELPWEGK